MCSFSYQDMRIFHGFRLNKQPPGPVILFAHSMGGLLAAEAATQCRRIVGLVAFDVPYLGMHPHVIISGIASLLPKDVQKHRKSEKELNDTHAVKFVDNDTESLRSSLEGV